MNNNEKSPNLIISLVPIVVLISLLIINVIIFKDDATGGPNQLALLSAGVVAIIIGIFFLKQDYHKIEKDIIKNNPESAKKIKELLKDYKKAHIKKRRNV